MFIASIDLTKAFDLLSRTSVFNPPRQSFHCPTKFLVTMAFFHRNMDSFVQHNGSLTDYFPSRSGAKQGCVSTPVLSCIFFCLLLEHASSRSEDGISLQTTSDGGLFNLARLRTKSNVRKFLVREVLFIDYAALTAHTENAIKGLVTHFYDASDALV